MLIPPTLAWWSWPHHGQGAALDAHAMSRISRSTTPSWPRRWGCARSARRTAPKR
jgi:hypothetical protein